MASTATGSSSSTGTTSDIIDVCPSGTLILKAKCKTTDVPHVKSVTSASIDSNTSVVPTNNKTFRIRVSKEAMSFSSTNFQAMLQGPFKEATQAEVEVDEDAETLLSFCYVVHHRLDKLGEITRDMLWSLAELADRRGATKTIGFWMGVQLSSAMYMGQDQTSVQGVPRMLGLGLNESDVLVMAYACELQEMVWKASRMFLVKHEPFTDSKDDPAHLFERCNATDVLKLLLEKRKMVLDRCLTKLKHAMLPQPSAYPCTTSLSKVGAVNRVLVSTTPSVFEVARGEASYLQTLVLVNAAKSGEDNASGYPSCKYATCPDCAAIKSRNLLGLLDDLRTGPHGLCLDCFKAGKEMEAFSDNFPCDKHN